MILTGQDMNKMILKWEIHNPVKTSVYLHNGFVGWNKRSVFRHCTFHNPQMAECVITFPPLYIKRISTLNEILIIV